MNPITERGDVWAAGIEDKPGSLANVLTGLREAGADLSFVLARREPDQPGKSVVYVTPLTGDAELEAAATPGFNLTARAPSVRVESQNRPGIAAALAARLAAAGLDRRGFSAAVLGTWSVLYVPRPGLRRRRRCAVGRPAAGLKRAAWGIRRPAPAFRGSFPCRM